MDRDAQGSGEPKSRRRPADAMLHLPVVYQELRRLAAKYMGTPGTTLQPTAIVHEAFLKLADGSYRDQSHFCAVAAVAMRQVLVDHARAKGARKRGGAAHRTLCDVGELGAVAVDVLELDDALSELRRLDERKAAVVELRVFGGLTIEGTAAHLGVSHMTVTKDWRFVRAWLARQFEAGAD